MVKPVQTLCGIQLSDKQTLLKYSLNDEEKLCENCREISPIPRTKDWSPRYKITGGEYAKRVLTDMLILYKALPEEDQIGIGFLEYFGSKNQRADLSNFLINPDGKIENVLEIDKALLVSIIGGEGRVSNKISFDLIAEFMPQIKEFFLDYLQTISN